MRQRKIKIAYLITGLGVGGAEKVIRDLVMNLDRDRFDVMIISLLPKGSLAQELEVSGIAVASLNMKSKFDARSPFRLIKILCQENPDILHTHLFHADIMGRGVGIFFKNMKIISTIHNVNIGNSLREKILRITRRFVDKNIAVSRAVLDRAKENNIARDDSVVIYNGVAPRSRVDKKTARNDLGISESEFAIVSVGSLTPKKGYGVLLDAVELLPSGNPFTFFILGEGSERKNIESRISKSPNAKIILVGATGNVSRYLAAADAFVMPSLWEGFSIALLEAALAELPIIATDVGGNAELIKDDEHGILIHSQNPVSLRSALLRVLEMTPENLRAMGQRAKLFAQELFSLDIMARNHESLYESIFNLKKNSKKIIFSSNASWYLWNFRRNLMRECSREGFEIIATSSHDEYSEKLSQEFTLLEMKNLKRSGKNPFRDLGLIFEYYFLYKKQKPDLVFNFTIKPNIYSSIACRVLGIDCISTVTGLGYSFLKSGYLQKITIFLYTIALAKNNFVVFQNQDDLDLFVSKKIISRNQAILIEGSGIDTQKFIPKEIMKSFKDEDLENKNFETKNKSFIFLLCARMLRDKGVVEFVQAAKIIKQQLPNTRFQLLGPMDIVNPACVSESELMSWQKEKVVEYLGARDDVISAIHDADCVVLPSYREGLPKSLLEAMSCAKPVIATDIPGCRSIVENNKNGFLVPVKNFQTLAEKMVEMMNLAEQTREKMGHIGRALVLEKFDERIIVRKYLELVNKIIR